MRNAPRSRAAVADRVGSNIADYVRLRFIMRKPELMRYLPLSDADRSEMLRVVGAGSIDDLFRDVPEELGSRARSRACRCTPPKWRSSGTWRALSRKNMVAGDVPFFLGCGAYRHHVPASVDHIIQRGEFLTSYTPYQPEIAQGTLQMLFEFQTQVARLFGCEVANASMYDGSTAMWEAIVDGAPDHAAEQDDHLVGRAPALRQRREDDGEVHRRRARDRASRADRRDRRRAADRGIDGETSAVVVQYPDILGRIADLTPIAEAAHAAGALLIAVVTEPVALGAIKSPGEMGADIVVGEGQSIGVGLQFGGPYVGLFACREKHVRQMPGRLAGETVDAEGKRGFVLTLSTREQHIRREKATSNICTSSVLCALAFTAHLTLLGEKGLRQLASLNHARACEAAERLSAIPGVELVNDSFFNEFTLKLPGRGAAGGPCDGREGRARRRVARPALSGRGGAAERAGGRGDRNGD